MTVLFDRTASHVQLSIPGYICKVLKRFAPSLTSGAKSPGIYNPPRYGQSTEQSPTVDDSPRVSPAEQLDLQGLIGAVLYYCLAVDPTGLPIVTVPYRPRLRPIPLHQVYYCRLRSSPCIFFQLP